MAQVVFSSKPVDVSCGGLHTCFRLQSTVWCWGSGSYGQLGNGQFSDELSPVETTDLYDAIDDPDNAGGIDNTEFEQTDIPSPFEIPLPEKNFVSPEERDQIRDWVLEINMDGSVGQSLPTRRCEHCSGEIYECSLYCPHCRAQWEPCIVTGLPLVKSDSVQCKICNKGAIREHWNDVISATMHCPWCKSMQTQY